MWYCILCFFILSGLFQGYVSKITTEEGEADFEYWSTTLCYMEYSISASLMVLCIGVESGILQIYTLMCMFVLMFTTMMLRLITHAAKRVGVALAATTPARLAHLRGSLRPRP